MNIAFLILIFCDNTFFSGIQIGVADVMKNESVLYITSHEKGSHVSHKEMLRYNFTLKLDLNLSLERCMIMMNGSNVEVSLSSFS